MKKRHLKSALYIVTIVCIASLLQVAMLLHTIHELIQHTELISTQPPTPQIELRVALKPTDDFEAYQHWKALAANKTSSK